MALTGTVDRPVHDSRQACINIPNFNPKAKGFLSPAHRGRGILVAPGFCPASRFLVGAKTTGQIFLKF